MQGRGISNEANYCPFTEWENMKVTQICSLFSVRFIRITQRYDYLYDDGENFKLVLLQLGNHFYFLSLESPLSSANVLNMKTH